MSVSKTYCSFSIPYFTSTFCHSYINSRSGWWLGLMVTALHISTQFLYIEPSCYWDGYHFTAISSCYLNQLPRLTQPGHPCVRGYSTQQFWILTTVVTCACQLSNALMKLQLQLIIQRGVVWATPVDIYLSYVCHRTVHAVIPKWARLVNETRTL